MSFKVISYPVSFMTASEEPTSRHSSRNVLELYNIFSFIGTSLQMFRLSRHSIMERLRENLSQGIFSSDRCQAIWRTKFSFFLLIVTFSTNGSFVCPSDLFMSRRNVRKLGNIPREEEESINLGSLSLVWAWSTLDPDHFKLKFYDTMFEGRKI